MGLTDDVTAAGLEFQYTGELGSVITSAFSVSRSGNQVFRVPLWDIAAQRSGTGGYPWYIEGDSSTVIYIKNVTDETQNYRMYLKLTGGDYVFPLTTVAPHQTTVIDVRKLRDTQAPDVNGQTIPAGETRGQVQWSLTGGVDRVVIGRSEQVDLVRGISSNYACQNCCPNNFYDGWLTPAQSSGFEGDQLQFIAMQQDMNCYGQVYPAYQAGTPTFTSSDLSICNPDWNTGTTTGVGPGEATISGAWTGDAWFFSPTGVCDYTPAEVLRDALCSVLAPPVDFIRASMYSANTDFDISRVATLNALDSGRPQEICGDDSTDFNVRVFFNLKSETTGLSDTRSSAKEFGEPPNTNDFIVRNWRFANVNTSSVPKHGEMVITLLRREGAAREHNSIRITVAGDYGTGAFSTTALVRVICP